MAKTTLIMDTVLGQQQEEHDKGPLLLASVQGVEGISVPYAYDVTMYHPIDATDIDPQQLINTPATIGMRGAHHIVFDHLNYYTYRRGIFLTFEKDETNERYFEQGLQTDYRIYKGRIVPAFKMMDFEIRYRVFEEMTVLEIMEELITGFPQIPSYSAYVDVTNIKEELPRMAYCVQFGESTFNFLQRLMGVFDIWYYFEHYSDDRQDKSGKNPREKMIIGNGDAPPTLKPIKEAQMNINWKPPELHDISGFQRCFSPMHKKIWVGNFNTLNPTDVPRGNTNPKAPYDLWPETKSDQKADPERVEREVFPAPYDHPKNDKDAMADLAKSKIEDEENNVFTVQGQSKNPTFVAGRTFHVKEDKTKAHFDKAGIPSTSDYAILTLSFAAIESAYGRHWYDDVANFFDSPIRWVWSQFRQRNLTQGGFLDPVAAMAAGGLSNWVQNQNVLNTTKQGPYTAAYAPNPPNLADSLAMGMNATFVQALIQMAVSGNVKEILQNHSDDFANAFIALPWDATYKQLPNPDGVKPRANGPHLAVVVGPDGTETEGNDLKGDIYADALGRVRVRFPWQRDVPPPPKDALIDPWESKSTEPFETDRRTCWVRVAEEWAGRYYGMQFLPRIGQEVIVSFLDGDPDRPIITGRVYNADYGATNLPFPNKDTASTAIKTIRDLPATARTDFPRSGIKTYSLPTKDPNGKALKPGYHLLRFDDTRGKEQYLMRSQGRMDVTAFGDYYDTTQGSRHLTVGGQDKDTLKCGGDRRVKIFKNYFLDVGKDNDADPPGSFCTTVSQNYELTVGTSPGKGDMLLDLKRNMIGVAQGNISLNAANIVLEAVKKLTLKVGASSIVITDGNLYIYGPPPTHIDTATGSPDKASNVNAQTVQGPTAADPGDDQRNAANGTGSANPSSGGKSSGGGGSQPAKREPTQANHAPDVSPAQEQQDYQNELANEGKPANTPASNPTLGPSAANPATQNAPVSVDAGGNSL